MCGIIGRISLKTNPIKTLKGLKELEYRGYDSYGISFYNIFENKSTLEKNIGELSNENLNKFKNIKSNIEIGHTRWATHGTPSKYNAHPHFDKNKKFIVVSNGIIENYNIIREELKLKKIEFISQTDTEILPQLYNYYFDTKNLNIKEELLNTSKKILNKLKGDFSYLLRYKNFVIGYKNINPLIFGKSEDEIFISSDSTLVQKNSEIFQVLNDKDLIILELNKTGDIHFNQYNEKFNEIKGGFEKSIFIEKNDTKTTKYYMEKEILEQKNIKNFITNENKLNMGYLISKLKNKKIFISAAGTSYHAAMFFHYKLLKNNIFSNLILASELNNYTHLINDSIIIVFSQSGETADLIYPLRNLENKNEIFTITNSPKSTLDRFAKKSIYLNCGKEISVASTKAFTFQIFFSLFFESMFKNLNIDEKINEFENNFEKNIQINEKTINEIVNKYFKSKDFFFLGRNQYYPLSLEGALKLKEISYIHAEGFAGGELKHGSLALITNNIPAIILGCSNLEIISNAIEIKTRGGIIIGISNKNNNAFNYFLKIPKNFQEIYSIILMQYLAFKITLKLGYNPDKPRNLAKSVTVK